MRRFGLRAQAEPRASSGALAVVSAARRILTGRGEHRRRRDTGLRGSSKIKRFSARSLRGSKPSLNEPGAPDEFRRVAVASRVPSLAP